MKLVIVESPYAGDVEKNVEFAQRCLHDCLKRNEAPFASHLLYTQPNVLHDNILVERTAGIQAGLEWRCVADYSVFYTDLGWSDGMLAALHSAVGQKREFYLRGLDKSKLLPPVSFVESIKKQVLEAAIQ